MANENLLLVILFLFCGYSIAWLFLVGIPGHKQKMRLWEYIEKQQGAYVMTEESLPTSTGERGEKLVAIARDAVKDNFLFDQMEKVAKAVAEFGWKFEAAAYLKGLTDDEFKANGLDKHFDEATIEAMEADEGPIALALAQAAQDVLDAD